MSPRQPDSAPTPEWQDNSDDEGVSLGELAQVLAARWSLIVFGTLLAGLSGLGLSYLITPTFTARTSFMPPQQQQSSAASALASLGGLAALAGAGGVKTPADQYVALMQSVTVEDRLIDQFKLLEVYDKKLRVEARTELDNRVRIAVGKKDGLITVEVDDHDPERAAAMANRHVDELRRMTSLLAVTEAQQRRAFFERELAQTRDRLTLAQQALQGSGFNAGALKAEPKAAAEAYAKLRAEVTTAEVRLQTLRGTRSEQATEVQQQLATLGALRAELARSEQATQTTGGPDYIGKYREFKYQEALFDVYARQYELARVDESREGALVQVVDPATPPEKKSKPKRSLFTAGAALAGLLLLCAWVLAGHFRRRPEDALAT